MAVRDLSVGESSIVRRMRAFAMASDGKVVVVRATTDRQKKLPSVLVNIGENR